MIYRKKKDVVSVRCGVEEERRKERRRGGEIRLLKGEKRQKLELKEEKKKKMWSYTPRGSTAYKTKTHLLKNEYEPEHYYTMSQCIPSNQEGISYMWLSLTSILYLPRVCFLFPSAVNVQRQAAFGKAPRLGCQERVQRGEGGVFLCLFKKQARMSTVTSVQVFGSPVILHSVYVYVGDRHISGAERFETFRGIFRAECLKVEGASATS